MTLLFIVLHCGHTRAQDIPPASAQHVSDTAGLLGADALILDNRLRQFEELTGHQFVVLTVPTTLPAASIDNYAHAVFQAWHLGRKGANDGLLLVVAGADRTARIEVGADLQQTMTDRRASRIVARINPYFKDGNFVGGIDEGVLEIMQTVTPSAANAPEQASRDNEGRVLGLTLTVVFGLIFYGMSLFFGILGLAATVVVAVIIPMFIYSDWRGDALGAALIAVWLVLRWWLIAANVRKYHLSNSRHPAATWLGAMLFAIGFGMARPAVAITQVSAPGGESPGIGGDTVTETVINNVLDEVIDTVIGTVIDTATETVVEIVSGSDDDDDDGDEKSSSS